jgi:hypothetical protein
MLGTEHFSTALMVKDPESIRPLVHVLIYQTNRHYFAICSKILGDLRNGITLRCFSVRN